ncbi:hypothetical protein NBRC116593_42790 [Sulfitobacter pacificus]
MWIEGGEAGWRCDVMAQWRIGNRAKGRCGLVGNGLLGVLDVWAKDRGKWTEIELNLLEAATD